MKDTFTQVNVSIARRTIYFADSKVQKFGRMPFRRVQKSRRHSLPLPRIGPCQFLRLPAYLHLFRRNHRAMARCAILRRGLIKEYRFPTDHLDVLMTGPAPYVLMRSLQRKAGARFVVE